MKASILGVAEAPRRAAGDNHESSVETDGYNESRYVHRKNVSGSNLTFLTMIDVFRFFIQILSRFVGSLFR